MIMDDDELSLDNGLYRWANLKPSDTGLPFVVFITSENPMSPDPFITLSRSPNIKDAFSTFNIAPGHVGLASGVLFGPVVDKVEAWIEKNQAVLMGYWDGTIPYTQAVMEQLVSING